MAGQSVKGIGDFINRVGTPLVDMFRTDIRGACNGDQSLYSFTLTQNYDIVATSVEKRGPTPRGWGERGAAYANIQTVNPTRSLEAPAKDSFGCFNSLEGR